jgi:hypothetical protein
MVTVRGGEDLVQLREYRVAPPHEHPLVPQPPPAERLQVAYLQRALEEVDVRLHQIDPGVEGGPQARRVVAGAVGDGHELLGHGSG